MSTNPLLKCLRHHVTGAVERGEAEAVVEVRPKPRKRRPTKAYEGDERLPRYVRCYDNGGASADRYTVVYTRTGDGLCHYVGMNSEPFHPQGIGMHGEDRKMIDRPKYGHLGKKIPFTKLPDDCRRLVLRDYAEQWGPRVTRKEYMDGLIAHDAYYLALAEVIGLAVLRDICRPFKEHVLNFDPVHLPIRNLVSHYSAEVMKLSWGGADFTPGTFSWSLSESVCIAGRVVQLMIEEEKGKR